MIDSEVGNWSWNVVVGLSSNESQQRKWESAILSHLGVQYSGLLSWIIHLWGNGISADRSRSKTKSGMKSSIEILKEGLKCNSHFHFRLISNLQSIRSLHSRLLCAFIQHQSMYNEEYKLSILNYRFICHNLRLQAWSFVSITTEIQEKDTYTGSSNHSSTCMSIQMDRS